MVLRADAGLHVWMGSNHRSVLQQLFSVDAKVRSGHRKEPANQQHPFLNIVAADALFTY